MKDAEKLYKSRFDHTKGVMRVIEMASTGGEDGVLLWLHYNGKTALAGDLSNALDLTSGRIANILKQLERKELITRTTGSDDKRKVVVTLTDKGETYIEEVDQKNLEKFERVLGRLEEEDAAKFVELAEKVLEAAEADES